MRARVTDALAISALSPLNVIGYLRYNGWMQYSETPRAFSVWVNHAHPDAEVVVPYKRDSSDFVSLLAGALGELEAAEGRSQIDIIRDLLNSGFDLVRLAARSENTSSGSIKIDEGIQLFEYAREIMMASACAAVRPRAVFHARKPQQANEYMEKARLGQTEHGSYVLTILSPVAPQLNAYSDTSLFPDEPFERQVMRTLTRAVGKAVDAAEQAATHRDFSPFQDAVSEGVSANLCEAMAGLFKIGEATEIGLSVAWAQNRPAPSNAPSSILITRDVVPAIAEAARIFRATDTLEAYLVQGPVVKLERSGDTAGRVTILANIEEVARKVVVELSPQDYDKATQAHREFKSVQVVGNVKRDGRSFCAFNAARFDVVTDEDEAGN